MIKYSLICANEHAFEGWFASSDAFDSQKNGGLVTCPFCDSREVEKSLMTPLISTGKHRLANSLPQAPELNSIPATNANISSEISDVMAKVRELRNRIQANTEDVGDQFPEEARKIHYGETEKRGIYGQAKLEDVRELMEEGIEVMPLPTLPEDRN